MKMESKPIWIGYDKGTRGWTTVSFVKADEIVADEEFKRAYLGQCAKYDGDYDSKDRPIGEG
jgi:hypothetical protein